MSGITEEVKQLVERQGEAWKAFKDANDARLAGLAAKFDDVVTNDKLKRINDTLDEVTDLLEKAPKKADLDKLSEKTDALEVAVKRSPSGGGGDVDLASLAFGFADGKSDPKVQAAIDAFAVHKTSLTRKGELKPGMDLTKGFDLDGCKAYIQSEFPAYLRMNEKAFGQRFGEKALIVGSDPDGGYTVPPTMSDRVITKQFETSTMRQLATVETIGGQMWQVPRDEGEYAFGWGTEVGTRSETNTSQLGMSQIPVWEWYALPKASQQMLEDSTWNVEAWISQKVGDVSARGHETAFFSGGGTDRPRGILTYTAGTGAGQVEQVAMGAASTLTADGFISIETALKEYYRRNARWLMSRTTKGALRKLKDGTGNYIWQEDYKLGVASATLLGYPVTGAEDMPAIGAGTLPVAFGDFRAAYTIVQRLGMSLLRDPYSAKPYVLFYFRGRLGGAVVVHEAYKLGVVSAS